MKQSLEEALKNADTTYESLVKIGDDVIAPYVRDIDVIVDAALKSPENLTNDQLRNIFTKLSLLAVSFGGTKEKSALRATCTEVLRKEAYAREFSLGEGAVAARDTNATLNISNNILAEALYSYVANQLKTKLDGVYRAVDTLKTNLITRLQEAKLPLDSGTLK